MLRPLCLIVNPKAGNGRARTLMPAVTEVLANDGAEHRIVESASLAHAKELVAEAAGRGEVAVAVGGDGMAGAMAGAAAAAGASYGLIPAGRGNDFAGVLGIPADPAAAARVLISGQPRQVDLIGVSTPDHEEVLVAGSVYAGLPALAGQVANATKLLGGPLVYPVAALRVLAGWRPVTFTVRIAGQAESARGDDPPEPPAESAAYEFAGYAVVVANSAFFGAGMQVAPPALIDDGVLDVVLMRHARKLTFVKALLKIKDGSHVALPQITLDRATEVTVTMTRDLPAAADGESLACADPLAAGTPLRIRVLPGALSVYADMRSDSQASASG
ncbi:MAG TPA: diacylglycerol kinase family protein [Streptosporangiaceae bacterium]|nr:diacylglycerol kinase family protein [Streptosporangiaceae bacterium]